VIARDDGTPDFHALRSRHRGHEAVLYAFDLIELDGDDLRKLPLIDRKRRLAKLIGKTKRPSIQFVEHLTGDGPTVFDHVCRMGLEGIVSKRVDAPYRSGPSKSWVKSKNPANEAVRRKREEGVALTSASAVRGRCRHRYRAATRHPALPGSKSPAVSLRMSRCRHDGFGPTSSRSSESCASAHRPGREIGTQAMW
jgi:ATP-dependent DNA ligase